jgi:hypothetical protein
MTDEGDVMDAPGGTTGATAPRGGKRPVGVARAWRKAVLRAVRVACRTLEPRDPLHAGVLPRYVDHLFAADDMHALVKRAVSVATGLQPREAGYVMKRDGAGRVYVDQSPSSRVVLCRESALDVLHVLDRAGVLQGMPCKPASDAGRGHVAGGRRKAGATPESMAWTVYRQECAVWAANMMTVAESAQRAATLTEGALLNVVEFLAKPSAAGGAKPCACAVCVRLLAVPELLREVRPPARIACCLFCCWFPSPVRPCERCWV